MIAYPNIDPEIVRIGPLAIRWYGVMYLVGFAASFFLVRKQLRESSSPCLMILWSRSLPADPRLLLGARVGHILFLRIHV